MKRFQVLLIMVGFVLSCHILQLHADSKEAISVPVVSSDDKIQSAIEYYVPSNDEWHSIEKRVTDPDYLDQEEQLQAKMVHDLERRIESSTKELTEVQSHQNMRQELKREKLQQIQKTIQLTRQNLLAAKQGTKRAAPAYRNAHIKKYEIGSFHIMEAARSMGAMNYWRIGVHVFQVIDTRNVILEFTLVEAAYDTRGNKLPDKQKSLGLVWIQGVPTSEMIDGGYYPYGGWDYTYICTETRTYETEDGSQTVAVLRPIDYDQIVQARVKGEWGAAIDRDKAENKRE